MGAARPRIGTVVASWDGRNGAAYVRRGRLYLLGADVIIIAGSKVAATTGGGRGSRPRERPDGHWIMGTQREVGCLRSSHLPDELFNELFFH